MYNLNVCMCVLMFILSIFNEANGACVLNLTHDFGSPAPVFLRKDIFLVPNGPSDLVKINKSQKLVAACPGSRRDVVLGNLSTVFEAVEAKCVTNTTFQVDDWRGSFKDIRCNGQPWFTTEPLRIRCHINGIMQQVGYKILSTFYKLYEACFDKDTLRTIYVKHELAPHNRFHQFGSRPHFYEGTLFGKARMSKIYKLANQMSRLNNILGGNKGADYLTKNQFLTRGHLAARADFSLRATQIASFHYVNTAPQWMRGNAGDWAALEEALRRRVASLNTTVVVYTGAHGVFTLKDNNGVDQEIYLDVDANNNGIVPVPMYFYKLVYDPKSKAATAFISINSSFYSAVTVNKLTFCNDVCDENPNFSWLKWRQSDGTPSFCCGYKEFVRKVDYLPQLNVKKMFY